MQRDNQIKRTCNRESVGDNVLADIHLSNSEDALLRHIIEHGLNAEERNQIIDDYLTGNFTAPSSAVNVRYKQQQNSRL